MTAYRRGLFLGLSVYLLSGCGEPRSDADSTATPTQATPYSTPNPPPIAPADKPAVATTWQLIPRNILFGNPQRAAPQLSPDGKRIAYLAPADGVMNVWVGPLDNLGSARPVTQEKKRAIRSFRWAYTNKHILYPQDVGGNENWHVHGVDLDTGKSRDLTPIDNIAAQMLHLSVAEPNEVLVGINDQSPQFHSPYRINLLTGERTCVFNNREFASFVVDEKYSVRFAEKLTPDGGREILRALRPASAPSSAEADAPASAPALAWERFVKVGPEDAMSTDAHGLDAAGKLLYLSDSRGRDTAALISHHIDSGDETMLAVDAGADAGGVLVHPRTLRVQAVSFTRERRRWQVLDPAIKEDIEALAQLEPGDFDVLSRSLDDKVWLVSYLMDNGPVRYYRFDHDTRTATFLFTNRPAIEKLPLVHMHPVTITARDGLKLVSYLSLPHALDPDQDGHADSSGPMVLLVHGGPWARDSWGYNSLHQWLANRGYAVLSVNFRGSTGFGKKLLNAANLEWAGKMHTDLIDAVNWTTKEGIADPKRIAIMGGSYGGYATLVGLTFTPDVFACGVDIVGPSNLVTLLNSIPAYWTPMIDMFATRVGDHRTEPGRSLLAERSPLSRVEKITKPLLIGQGANDPRVKQAESDQIVQAMQERKIPVTYVLFPDEGHGFAKPENNMAFFAVVEQFLAAQLGGMSEPIGGDFKSSSITVPAGAEQVKGVAEAMTKK